MLKRLADYVSEVMVSRDPTEVRNGVRRRRHFRRNWNRTARPMRRRLLGLWAQEGTMAAAFAHDGRSRVSPNTRISNEAHFGLPDVSRMVQRPKAYHAKKTALDGPVGSIRERHRRQDIGPHPTQPVKYDEPKKRHW